MAVSQNLWYQYARMVENEGFKMDHPSWLDDDLILEFHSLVDKYSRFELFKETDAENLARYVATKKNVSICEEILIKDPSYNHKMAFKREYNNFQRQLKSLTRLLNLDKNNLKAVDRALAEHGAEFDRFVADPVVKILAKGNDQKAREMLARWKANSDGKVFE
ncbi:hypothetical protein [Neobacillus ginsengisoli]|uniref:Uncharacterized protein n=1 Tax=Neobacillus ginsengisoli TaxID=904295 RepID=A0ABT9XRC7_9BACI|nr:hypothetical protein [Neobacillus ginsengisoli]MDQ0197953.1 hypothetical protein [Neobacillus ginsengisoli]